MSGQGKVAGVIGGMGPEATVEFLRRIVAATPAADDADHIRILVDNNPGIPSRIAALIEGTGADPAPVLCEMARGLERQGADFLAVPCNTAHYYLPRIARAVSIPVLDMVGLAIEALPQVRAIGMLASPAVQKVGLYAARLADAGHSALFPDAAGEGEMLGLIRAVKANAVTPAHLARYEAIACALERAGAEAFLIACTELSVIGPPRGILRPCIDALDELVRATVRAAKPA